MKSKYRNWTQEQVDYLVSNYRSQSLKELSRYLGKGVGAIYNILHKENVEGINDSSWDKDEIRLLKQLYPSTSNQELSRVFERSEDACQIKAAALGLKKEKWWSEEERNKLRELKSQNLTYVDIAKQLNRSKVSVHNQLIFLGLTEQIKRFTKSEIATIQNLAESGDFSYFDIAKHLGCLDHIDAIRQLCHLKGWHCLVQKSKSFGHQHVLSILLELYPNNEIWEEFFLEDRLFLDLFIPDLNLGFEYDGQQHFRYTPQFHKSETDLEDSKIRDRRKDTFCFQEGIRLIRIRYDEKLTKELLIQKISEVETLTETPTLTKAKQDGGYYKGWALLETNKAKLEKQKLAAKEYRKKRYEFLKQLKEQTKNIAGYDIIIKKPKPEKSEKQLEWEVAAKEKAREIRKQRYQFMKELKKKNEN